MWVLQIDIVDKEHSVERLDEVDDLFGGIISWIQRENEGGANQYISCRQQCDSNIIWRICFLFNISEYQSSRIVVPTSQNLAIDPIHPV